MIAPRVTSIGYQSYLTNEALKSPGDVLIGVDVGNQHGSQLPEWARHLAHLEFSRFEVVRSSTKSSYLGFAVKAGCDSAAAVREILRALRNTQDENKISISQVDFLRYSKELGLRPDIDDQIAL